LVVFGLFYLLYLIIGASIFSAIEGPQEKALVKELKEQRALFLKDHSSCISGKDFHFVSARILRMQFAGELICLICFFMY
jgi:hypothetical protein